MTSADAPIPAPQAPRLVAGRYRLGARRGTSVDAALFEAFDEELQRPVVVKMVHPDISARPEVQAAFRSAMELAGTLHHPNIAVAHSWGITEWNGYRVLYVVSEQLTGGSLRDVLDRGRLLSPSQAVLVGLDACKALDVLHRRGLAHGDLRPSTLVFGDDRRLRIIDPGLSQVLTEASGGPSHRPNDIAKYTSPEQAAGLPLRPNSDVYSLCLSLIESLTGSVPFVGDSTVATLANRIDKLLPVSADLGPLAAVLERAGRPSPDDRYSAAEFGRALVQSAERLPRPDPLPILANSLFGADPGQAGELVDPTGPLLASRLPRPPAAPAAVAAAALPPTAPIVVTPPPPPTVPTPVIVPDILDLTPTTAVAATAMAPAVQLDPDYDPRDEFPEERPAPSGGKKWIIAVLVIMALAGGALAWYRAKPEQRVVPTLAGMEQGVALNAIAGDFKPTTAQEPSESVPVGVVIRTEPGAGSQVQKNAGLTLFVSTGPAPRVLPELVGLTVSEATARLQQLGLTVEVGDPVFDEVAPLNAVIKWTVPDAPTLVAGGNVTKGTAVRLIASKGPAPRPAPDLTNKTLADATAALTALQLHITTNTPEFSPTVPAGSVIRQDPAPGTPIVRDGSVNVTLSKGPDLITIPNLAGMDVNAATAALTGAGFVIAGTIGDATHLVGEVQVNGATVAVGEQFPRGQPVTIVFVP
jgi:eukaryotic-like serine/threonine-protein kinase